MAFDKISVIAHTIRVLLLFIRKQRGRQNIAVGTPYIAPVVFPCLYRISGKVQIILCAGINEAGYVDRVVVIRSILNITGIRAVAAVIGAMRLEVCPVLIDGTALLQSLIERTRPLSGVLIKVKSFHQVLGVKMFNLYS